MEYAKPQFKLRSLTISDTDELFALTIRNKDHLKRFLNWMKDGYEKKDTIQFLEESLEKESKGKMLLYAITINGSMIGLVDLHGINMDKNAEIGYWLDKGHEGKGIVTEAVKILIEEGFHKLGLHRIGLRCATLNERSCAIPKRLGFTKEGILRESTLIEEKFLDLEIWSLLKDEWII